MEKRSFDLGWEYSETGSSMMVSLLGAQWAPVTLPHDAAIHKPRSQDAPSGSLAGHAWSGIVSYRKRFQVPQEWLGKSIQVEFEGIYMKRSNGQAGEINLVANTDGLESAQIKLQAVSSKSKRRK